MPTAGRPITTREDSPASFLAPVGQQVPLKLPEFSKQTPLHDQRVRSFSVASGSVNFGAPPSKIEGKFRLATPEDSAKVKSYWESLPDDEFRARTHGNAKTPESINALANLSVRNDDDATSLLFEDTKGNLLGICNVVALEKSPGGAEVAISVRKDAQGQGIGKEFMQKAEVVAGEKKFKFLLGYPDRHNESAMRLVQEWGQYGEGGFAKLLRDEAFGTEL